MDTEFRSRNWSCTTMNLCSPKWQMVLVSIHQCQAISSKSSATKPWKVRQVQNLWGTFQVTRLEARLEEGASRGPFLGKRFLKAEGDSLFEGLWAARDVRRAFVALWWGTVTWVPAACTCNGGGNTVPTCATMAQVIWARAAAVASYQIRARVENIYLAGEMIQIEMRIFLKWVGSTTN